MNSGQGPFEIPWESLRILENLWGWRRTNYAILTGRKSTNGGNEAGGLRMSCYRRTNGCGMSGCEGAISAGNGHFSPFFGQFSHCYWRALCAYMCTLRRDRRERRDRDRLRLGVSSEVELSGRMVPSIAGSVNARALIRNLGGQPNLRPNNPPDSLASVSFVSKRYGARSNSSGNSNCLSELSVTIY